MTMERQEDRMGRRRSAAVVALALAGAALVMTTVSVLGDPLREALRALLLIAAMTAGWRGLRRRGAWRLLWLGGGVLLLATDVALLVRQRPLLMLASWAAVALAIAAGRQAFTGRVALPPGSRPRKPVLFFNPRSGGGKSARYHLADEARARGIEPLELAPGADLVTLVR